MSEPVTGSETHLYFRIALPAERFLRYYSGNARAVIVSSEDGRRVQLPASTLRPFVTQAGIYGRFQLTLGARNNLIEIRRAN